MDPKQMVQFFKKMIPTNKPQYSIDDVASVTRTPIALMIGGVMIAIEMLDRQVNPVINLFYRLDGNI